MPQVTVTSSTSQVLVLGSILGRLNPKAQRTYTLTQDQLDEVTSQLIQLENTGLAQYTISRTDDPADAPFENWVSRIRVKTISTTTYTVIPDDEGCLLMCTNVAGCTITIPLGLDIGFSASATQWAAGAVEFAAGAGLTLRAPATAASPPAVSAQYTIAGITMVSATEALAFGSLA